MRTAEASAADAFWSAALVHDTLSRAQDASEGARSVARDVAGSYSPAPSGSAFDPDVEIANDEELPPLIKDIFDQLKPLSPVADDDVPFYITRSPKIDDPITHFIPQRATEGCATSCDLEVFIDAADVTGHKHGKQIADYLAEAFDARRAAGGAYLVPPGHPNYGQLGPQSSVPITGDDAARTTVLGRLKNTTIQLAPFFALFTFSCDCEPTATLRWFKSLPGESEWTDDNPPRIGEWTITDGGDEKRRIGGACWILLLDTPMRARNKTVDWRFKIVGKVDWNEEASPRQCKEEKYVVTSVPPAGGGSVAEVDSDPVEGR